MKELIEMKIKDLQEILGIWDIETGSSVECSITEKFTSSLQEVYEQAIKDCVGICNKTIEWEAGSSNPMNRYKIFGIEDVRDNLQRQLQKSKEGGK